MSRWPIQLLCINAVVVMVVLVVSSNQAWGMQGTWHAMTYALVSANIAAGLGFALKGVLEALVRRNTPLLAVVAGGVIVATAVGCLSAQVVLMEIGFIGPRYFWKTYLETLQIGMPLAIVFGLGAFVYGSLQGRIHEMEAKVHAQEVSEQRALKLAAEARLHSLEARIHPHFLFNTLNSVMSLIVADPVKAEQTVGRLAVLLRVSLDNTNQPLIPLRQELEMIQSYIDIESVRFGGKLQGFIDVAAEFHNAQVPPMALQSLVENAVKHGITPQDECGKVWVSASAKDGELSIEVRDSGPGFDLAAIPAGRGLDNLVERLDALFGDKARLNVVRRDGYSVVEMILPRV
jgi:sensor histidine kinase YesM